MAPRDGLCRAAAASLYFALAIAAPLIADAVTLDSGAVPTARPALAAATASELDVDAAKAPQEAYADRLLTPSQFDVIKRHAGLYNDRNSHTDFKQTVLVTASNLAYREYLANWRCHADRLKLDYVVVAMDPETFKEVGPERAILVNSSGGYRRGLSGFRSRGFNAISCNKMKMVLEILQETGLDVVFSDPDNVLRKDPFAVGASLGDEMRLGAYQYIYQQNHAEAPGKHSRGKEVREANTGFYFVSGTQKQTSVRSLFSAALQECKERPKYDDQTNFWLALRNMRSGKGKDRYGSGSFECADLCGSGPTCQAKEEEVLSYCEMDPWQHATGGWDVKASPKDLVTFHANFASGDGKIQKLKDNGLWDCHA